MPQRKQRNKQHQKISYQEFIARLSDPDIPESDLLPYLKVDKDRSTAFDPVLFPNPKLVVLNENELAAENAMQVGNGFCRWRRQVNFKRRLKAGDTSPVLVSEGDSWFQFPFFLADVIDQLGAKYLVWSVGAAGDSAKNMILSSSRKGKTEYIKELKRQKQHVRGFLLSAAGNDVIGEDEDGEPTLAKLLKQGNGTDALSYVDIEAFGPTLTNLRAAYMEVIGNIRATPGFEKLPIIFHGYDYPIPGSKNDSRNPIYAKADQWLGKPMRQKKINTTGLQKAVMKILIDCLYDMLNSVAATDPTVFVVDVRKTLTRKSDWNDEIHPTDRGFAQVARKFEQVLKKAGVG